MSTPSVALPVCSWPGTYCLLSWRVGAWRSGGCLVRPPGRPGPRALVKVCTKPERRRPSAHGALWGRGGRRAAQTEPGKLHGGGGRGCVESRRVCGTVPTEKGTAGRPCSEQKVQHLHKVAWDEAGAGRPVPGRGVWCRVERARAAWIPPPPPRAAPGGQVSPPSERGGQPLSSGRPPSRPLLPRPRQGGIERAPLQSERGAGAWAALRTRSHSMLTACSLAPGGCWGLRAQEPLGCPEVGAGGLPEPRWERPGFRSPSGTGFCRGCAPRGLPGRLPADPHAWPLTHLPIPAAPGTCTRVSHHLGGPHR